MLSLALKPANMATGMAGRMTKKEKLISGGAVAVVGAGASVGLMATAVPLGCLALLFLPLTVMGGVSRERPTRMIVIVLFRFRSRTRFLWAIVKGNLYSCCFGPKCSEF